MTQTPADPCDITSLRQQQKEQLITAGLLLLLIPAGFLITVADLAVGAAFIYIFTTWLQTTSAILGLESHSPLPRFLALASLLLFGFLVWTVLPSIKLGFYLLRQSFHRG